MDLETAQKALGLDRLLVIGLILLLHEKGLIKSGADMDSLLRNCRSTIRLFRKLRDPVVNIQLDKTEAELEHFFSSFKLPPT